MKGAGFRGVPLEQGGGGGGLACVPSQAGGLERGGMGWGNRMPRFPFLPSPWEYWTTETLNPHVSLGLSLCRGR